jgi:hypothetical protein
MMRRDAKSLRSEVPTKWDIVEDLATVVSPNTEIGRRGKASPAASWIAISSAAVTLFLGFIIGSPVQVNALSATHCVATTVSPGKNLAGRRRTERAQASDGPDTHVGMSPRRLAALLPTHFQPADQEVDYSTDYSFF